MVFPEKKLQTLLQEPTLNPGLRCLSLALDAIVSSRFDIANTAFEWALRHGATPMEAMELAASSHLFGGFPRAINGLEALTNAMERRGTQWPPCMEESPPRNEAGSELFARIYGSSHTRVRKHLANLHPPFEHWIIEHAYGRVLSRPELSVEARELCAVGALVILEVPRQLRSHVRGALRVGATAPQIEEVVRTAFLLATEEQSHKAQEALSEEGFPDLRE